MGLGKNIAPLLQGKTVHLALWVGGYDATGTTINGINLVCEGVWKFHGGPNTVSGRRGDRPMCAPC